MNNRILLVEDSKEIHRMVNGAVSSFSEVTWVETMKDALEIFSKEKFDLVLLDIELPDGSGIEICSSFQTTSPTTPIFFLTSKTDLSEKVLGFSAGAEDYITKPFQVLELKARVEAKLKKSQFVSQNANILKWSEIEINKSRQEVKVLNEDQMEKIDLTALEFKLLTYFAEKPGEVVPRDQVLDDIWGKDIHVYSRSVDTHISKLRKKLGPVSEIIASVHGAGYKFAPSEC